jgi:acyl-CoA synthetase (AMP-forming)/AMP-acid ligase II
MRQTLPIEEPMDIGTLLTRHARYRPSHVAVVYGDRRLTFREFNQRVNRLAHALTALGLKKGDKLAVILPNCLELLDIYWATAKTGIVVVPMSPLLRGPGLITLLRDSDAALVISNASMVETLDIIKAELPNVPVDRYILTDAPDIPGYHGYQALTAAASDHDPYVALTDDDLYNIIYSSGTTGLPKGIVHTHYIRGMYGMLFAGAYRLTPESIVLHAGSLVFNGAFCTLMPAMYHGATYILHHRFEAETFIETIARERVTHVIMVPSQIIALLHSPRCTAEHLHSLEMLCSVGAPLHREHKDALHRRLPGVFYELYGLTEGFITILDKYDYVTKPDSVGVPPPFFDMRIVNERGEDAGPHEVGEIVGRGPILMPGYYKRPDLTAHAIVDGWLHTGDLGYVDEDGFLYLVDRQKDMIITSGANVYPRDIEEIAVQHPAVREAAVFGIPDDRRGEVPLVAIILKQLGTTTPEDLRTWINERVAVAYQRVHTVVLMEDFPRSVAGKTLKRVMREPYWVEQGTSI